MLHNTQTTPYTRHVSLIDQLGLVRRLIYTSMSALQTEDVEFERQGCLSERGFMEDAIRLHNGKQGSEGFESLGPPEIKNPCISAAAASMLTAVLSAGFMELKYEICGWLLSTYQQLLM